jgi:hypothetical protein
MLQALALRGPAPDRGEGYPEVIVKIRQYCSVCKEELDMEVVPTTDGEDDGVLWLRCPRCQGFLPKISGSFSPVDRPPPGGEEEASGPDQSHAAGPTDGAASDAVTADDSVGQDSEFEAGDTPLEEEATVLGADEQASDRATGTGGETPDEGDDPSTYAAELAAMDILRALPYRPWDRYEVGDVIHQLAWDDYGVVVAKETLPGQRSVLKVIFQKSGIVRLIEAAASRP